MNKKEAIWFIMIGLILIFLSYSTLGMSIIEYAEKEGLTFGLNILQIIGSICSIIGIYLYLKGGR